MEKTKLLLVDDEEHFVAVMEKRLSRRGLKVVEAYSAEQALEKLAENPDTEVVVLDVRMPGKDGIETLRDIKRSYPSVEVIMLTCHAMFEASTQAMDLGAFDYLMKPADMDELVVRVQEAKARKKFRDRAVGLASQTETWNASTR